MPGLDSVSQKLKRDICASDLLGHNCMFFFSQQFWMKLQMNLMTTVSAAASEEIIVN